MSSFVVAAFKVIFLLLLWLFILVVANIIRTDMFGRTTTAAELAQQGVQPGAEPAAKKGRSRRRGRGRVTQTGRLVVVAGRAAGVAVPLNGLIQIGRSADSTVDIDDDYASSHHARLWQQDDGGWVIEDLQSTNGTYVNGIRLDRPTLVNGEDIIRIGRSQLKLEL